MRAFSRYIKQRALELGLVPVGITTAEPLIQARQQLELLAMQGIHVPFTSGELCVRTTPALTWPQARSIVMVGLPFAVSQVGPSAQPLEGYFSGGSYFQDYHRILKHKLSVLAGLLEEQRPGIWTALFVDTGPLVERALGWRAGLGVWGRNSFLLDPRSGSPFYLGGIVTDMNLQADEPRAQSCLQCDRCRKACPTQALMVPYRIDHRRCLSYWTQTKETVPREYRALLGNRIYGCDDCLRACPMIRPSTKREITIDLVELIALSGQEFRRRFAHSGFGWRGRNIIQRNAVFALGNSQDPSAVPVLTQLLMDGRAVIRCAAAWGLERCDSLTARDVLLRHLGQEPDADVRKEIMDLLTA